jgi:phage minor structural protein
MNFLFFDRNDAYLFMRTDATDAHFVHSTLNLTAVFPVDSAKMIEEGIRIGYLDKDDNFQLFEIRVLTNDLEDSTQSIDSAEHIAIAELTDEIVESEAPTTKDAQEAATIALTDTAWEIGTYVASDDYSTEWSYATVWACLCDVRDTWGVRIVPRLTISGTEITHRYIDIVSETPVNRGVRLEVNKNIEQAGVTYDDHAQYTALYGFGKEMQSDTGSEKVSFSGIEWATPTNPANKPIGQAWVEDAAATALYGRNGRKRVGIVEFPDIEDTYDLIDATWIYLQASLLPSVTINCTILDLYNLGYNDELIELNDSLACIIDPLGVEELLGVVDIDEDLLRPENTKPTIGVYRPDITDMINANIADTRENGRVVGQPATGLYTSFIAIYENHIIVNGAEVDIQTDDFQVKNLDGNNMLQITAEDEETGEPGARLKIGETGYPPKFEDDFTLPIKNIGLGNQVNQLHFLTSAPSDSLGNDGDVAFRYAGSGASFSDITPALGSYETAERFGLTRVWNRTNGSAYSDIGNSSAARRGSYWSFTTPAAGLSGMGFNFTAGKIVDDVWYGWNLDLPLTIAVFSGTGSSVALGSATFIPSNNMSEESIALTFSTPLTGSTTYYVAIYDPSSSYNKSAALVLNASVVIPGDSSTASVGIYVKVAGAYVEITAAVLALLTAHTGDTDNPHEVTTTQIGAVPTSRTVNSKALSSNITLTPSDIGAVPTSRTVNGKALSSNITLDETDVGAAADDHNHGSLLNDGTFAAGAGLFVTTGVGGGITTATGLAARGTMRIFCDDTEPASPANGDLWFPAAT